MDPTLKIKIIVSLKEQMKSLSPQMRTAAKYVIDHPTDFGLDSIRDTARKTGVSTYVFVQLSKTMGFTGYREMRQPFRNALVDSPSIQEHSERFEDQMGQGKDGRIYADAARNALSIVTRSLERQQLEELVNIADMLISARSVYLTAVRSSYAVAYYFHYVGRMALPSLQLIPRHMNSAIDDLNDAQTGDVLIAITVTPYSIETIKACEFARKRGVKLLLISDSEIVFPHLDPDHTLVSSVLSTHNFGCFSGMMAAIEVLLSILMDRGGDAAQARIRTYEKLRIENNAYWVAPKKH
ncbi:MurR/RpiR family transcriptional regulator [Alisedimentitalea sp. MJ-SS2]|uniref:MurR/RpiR family transcriptional regulator n=1 Tax=Aliisedimentitalea sp. MJ-SS2 TaxID=3049795 RepID=UPI00290AFB5F|nr:MurR/RpiR family transcriptional regulator [Alisedimentitalea sp. MJ-SS2]MDU8929595.1 MurR/RpiR family transcriptional regulator [Alisedimentitalea sp. MJ-SS2]